MLLLLVPIDSTFVSQLSKNGVKNLAITPIFYYYTTARIEEAYYIVVSLNIFMLVVVLPWIYTHLDLDSEVDGK